MKPQYTVEQHSSSGRVLVLSDSGIPVEDFCAMAKTWGRDGLVLVPGIAAALDALFAACRPDDVEPWRQEVIERAKLLAEGDPELEWLFGPDTGTSSKTIFSVLSAKHGHRVRNERGFRPAVPNDPDDFGRCHRLLAAIPGWRERLPEMSNVSPVWKRLVEKWERLTALWLQESPTHHCPVLYDEMQALLEGGCAK